MAALLIRYVISSLYSVKDICHYNTECYNASFSVLPKWMGFCFEPVAWPQFESTLWPPRFILFGLTFETTCVRGSFTCERSLAWRLYFLYLDTKMLYLVHYLWKVHIISKNSYCSKKWAGAKKLKLDCVISRATYTKSWLDDIYLVWLTWSVIIKTMCFWSVTDCWAVERAKLLKYPVRWS